MRPVCLPLAVAALASSLVSAQPVLRGSEIFPSRVRRT